MSGVVSGLTKFFSQQRIIIICIFIAVAFFLKMYLDKFGSLDRFSNADMTAPYAMPDTTAAPVSETQSSQNIHSVANPSELLPRDANSQWGDLNQLNQNNITTPDLLTAGYHIGLDTVGQTLRNANLQLRSDPVIAKVDVGPWNHSTVEPDLARTPLELGCMTR
jgi:hypothetical protein